jgi:hypothetical protein
MDVNLPNEIIKDAAKKSLAVYMGAVHMTEAGRPAIPPKHLKEQVIPVIENDSLGNTVIIAPPGSAKTTAMIAAGGWWIGRDPTQHIAFISNTGGQAGRRSVSIRDTIESNPAYHAIFPHVKPNSSRGWGGGGSGKRGRL